MKINPTAASLLGFLEEGEQTGYDLAKTAEALIGPFWSLTRSQIYRELAALAQAGLVEAGEPGPRSRQPYRLTSAGREAFLAWVSEPPAAEQIRFPLLLSLSFGRWLGAERVAAMLAEHRAEHAGRLSSYRALGEAGDPYLDAVLSFGIHYEEAVLAWMDALPEELALGPETDSRNS
ncbi:MAG: PadR family transcriptional regulator [Acidimicrobiales bacterium]